MRRILAITTVLCATQARANPKDRAAYERLLCADRAGCAVTDVTSVAASTAGAAQAVVTVRPVPAHPSDAFSGCAQAEYWLVTGPASRPVRRQLLASGLSGECAATGDHAAITESTFDFDETVGGGHADHYSHSHTVSLSPLAFDSEHASDAARYPDTNEVEHDWSWRAFAGTASAHYFRCDASGAALTDSNGPLVHWARLPAVPAGARGVTSLGACAAHVDGVHDGFTLHGKPTAAVDASFRAVLVGRELLVEVTDDHWVGPGKDWKLDDHLEIWLAREGSPARLDRCEDLRAAGALEWGVRVSDGTVFAAGGHPRDPLVVRRVHDAAKDGDPALLAITLPRWFDAKDSGITVAYSDSDDGTTQKRLIATSELQPGKRWTIGRTRVIAPREATCVVRGGRLEPELNHAFKSDEPVIGYAD